MGVVQLPDDLKQVIDRQVAEGRVASAAKFLAEAVQRYAEALDLDEDEIIAAYASCSTSSASLSLRTMLRARR